MSILRDPEGHEIGALSALASFEGLDVLEIGAGDGRLTWPLARAARTWLAVEPDAEAMAAARAALPAALAGRVELREDDVLTMPLPDDAFDLALLSRSL